MSVVAMIFISTSVYLYNDFVDHDMDKLISKKNARPFTSGKVSKKFVMRFIYLSAFIGLLIVSITNIFSLIFSTIYLILFTVYSYPKIYLKRRFIIKESIIALGFPLCSLVGSYAAANRFSMNALFAATLLAIFAFMAMPALNDATDIEADKLFGVKSIAVVLNWKRKIQLLIIGVIAIMTLTPLTYISLGFNIILPIMVVAGSLIFLRFIFPIMINIEKSDLINMEDLFKAKKIGYIYFVLLQIFMIIGSLSINIYNF